MKAVLISRGRMGSMVWELMQGQGDTAIARLDQANTRKPAKKSDQKGGGQNRFHNFSQRQYDYDALEQQLLRK